MKCFMSREHIESKLERLQKKSYNRYYWWRRYSTRHELSNNHPLFEKIKNGDYDVSDYIYQSELEHYLMQDKLATISASDEKHDVRGLFMTRARKLNEDFQKDERNIMQALVRDFAKTFKKTKKEIEQTMESFDGSLEDLFNFYKKQQICQ